MISKLSNLKKVLEEYDISAKKKFGQNFLIDTNIALKIIKVAISSDLIIEIGPGLGSLSELILNENKTLYAYEIDEDMVKILNDRLGNNDKFHLFKEDFLEVDLNNVPYKNEEISICSNLPYYVTTPILLKLFESDLKINKITVMVQKEVADRFKAKVNDKDYNALSIIVNYLYDVKYEMDVKKSVFYPSPNVDSAVISFIPHIERDKDFELKFFSLIKKCFTHRRKTLYNNLKEDYSKEILDDLYKKLNFKDSIRAQEIDLDGYLKMNEVLNEN